MFNRRISSTLLKLTILLFLIWSQAGLAHKWEEFIDTLLLTSSQHQINRELIISPICENLPEILMIITPEHRAELDDLSNIFNTYTVSPSYTTPTIDDILIKYPHVKNISGKINSTNHNYYLLKYFLESMFVFDTKDGTLKLACPDEAHELLLRIMLLYWFPKIFTSDADVTIKTQLNFLGLCFYPGDSSLTPIMGRSPDPVSIYNNLQKEIKGFLPPAETPETEATVLPPTTSVLEPRAPALFDSPPSTTTSASTITFGR